MRVEKMLRNIRINMFLQLFEYAIWFLIFMLVESFVNTRVGEVLGAEWVDLFYGIFILFTAIGFISFGIFGEKIESSRISAVVVALIGMILLGGCGFINSVIILIPGAAISLLSLGFLGGKILNKLSYCYDVNCMYGTNIGCAMAIAIFFQFIIQQMSWGHAEKIICNELLFSMLLIFEIFIPKIISNTNKDKENNVNNYTSSIWIYIIATILMTVILSLNDAYLVDLSAHTATVELFGWVRLFYCIGLVLAGIIYDYKNALYFNIFVAGAMMLSTVAYAFMGNTTNYNVNMSIMYFYCGFYVMFFTIHFIRISLSYRENNKQYMISGLGRIIRCLTTSIITIIMLFLGDLLSVQTMIVVSCILSIALMFLFSMNGILVINAESKNINDSIEVSGQGQPLIKTEHHWRNFVGDNRLTEREGDVLEKLIFTERNLQEISDDLNISKRVVQRHITSIYEKTKRSTRIGLLQLYVEYINKQ